MNRRALIVGAAATLTVSTGGASANLQSLPSLPAPSPVAILFREWTEAFARECAAYDADDTDAERLSDLRYDIEERMMDTPCETPLDWLMKSAAWSNFGEGSGIDKFQHPQVWAEAREMIGGAA